ncbi:unnamed protein product [Moneuplotes crassus]|uniref:Uncharacterized protein n=1 Tax=Euplotes crassus TaxID=5936 RepID=A0AAD1XVA2_EUPCR|nr:unnamed protein product [Moneuplotes crassus]
MGITYCTASLSRDSATKTLSLKNRKEPVKNKRKTVRYDSTIGNDDFSVLKKKIDISTKDGRLRANSDNLPILCTSGFGEDSDESPNGSSPLNKIITLSEISSMNPKTLKEYKEGGKGVDFESLCFTTRMLIIEDKLEDVANHRHSMGT